MFVELTKEAYDKFKPYLEKNDYKYSVSDATLSKDSIEHIRVDFEDVTPEQALTLARQIDFAYGLIAANSGTDKVKEVSMERD